MSLYVNRQNCAKRTTKYKTGKVTKVGSEILKILDAFPFYAMLVDAGHYILLANKATQQDLGLNPEQIVGEYCPKVVHGLNNPFRSFIALYGNEVPFYFDSRGFFANSAVG